MCAEGWRRCVWIERVLLGTGFVCLTWWGVASVQATRYQADQRAEFERMRRAAPVVVNASAVVATGAAIGSLDIPRLGLSAMIAQGDDDATLNSPLAICPTRRCRGRKATVLWPDIATRSSDRFNTSALVTNCACQRFTATSDTRCERR